MALVVALPGAAQASESPSTASLVRLAQSPAAASVGAPAIGTLARGARVSTRKFQGDCGWFTCTIRLNRAATRSARDAGWLISAAAGMCAVLASGPGAVVCGAAVAPAAVGLAVFAGRYWEEGNCLGIKLTHPPIPPRAWPSKVRRGKYNCG
jgi:hypothetical protein